MVNQAGRIDKLRFAIGAGNTLMSSLWVVFFRRNDVYIGVRNLAASLKLSLHGSGISQLALTDHYWEHAGRKAQRPMLDRSFARWKRAPVPDDGANEIVSVWFPRDNQVPRKVTLPSKPVVLVAPAAPGKAVRLCLFESRAAAPTLEDKFKELGLPVGYIALDDGRYVSIVLLQQEFDAGSLEQIRSGRGNGTIFNPDAAPQPRQTVSGLSALTWIEPCDGRPFHLAELHGINLRRET